MAESLPIIVIIVIIFNCINNSEEKMSTLYKMIKNFNT